ncbi:hypothetical protein DSECCO2_126540 [anaerobic digester metagenome]
MPYMICESCGGYYELMEDESPEDFDNCQCGGNLRLVDSINEIQDEIQDQEKQHLICPNCGNNEYEGLFCSKCGGKLITLKEDVLNSGPETGFKKISDTKNAEIHFPGETRGLFERVKLIAVVDGILFFVIAAIGSMFILFLTMPNSLNFSFGFSVLNAMLLTLVTISGVLAAYLSKSDDYFDGALNALTVGFIVGSVTGILTFSVLYLLANTALYAIFGALGGLIYLWFKKKYNN